MVVLVSWIRLERHARVEAWCQTLGAKGFFTGALSQREKLELCFGRATYALFYILMQLAFPVLIVVVSQCVIAFSLN